MDSFKDALQPVKLCVFHTLMEISNVLDEHNVIITKRAEGKSNKDKT